MNSSTFQSRRARIKRQGSKTCQMFHLITWVAILTAGGVLLLTIRVQKQLDLDATRIIPPPPSQQVRYKALPNGKRTILFQRKYDKLILLVHIHKSAGGFLCKRAFDNRLSASYATSCNVQEDQYCCGQNDTLAGLHDFVNVTSFDLVATEREMQETMDTSILDYIVSLRDSKSRYYSHYQHVLRHWYSGPQGKNNTLVKQTSDWLGNDATSNQKKSIKKKFDPVNNQRSNFTTWIKGQPDNWNLRILCGPKCKERPKFQITQELFHFTLQRLASFRHIVFVEDMQDSYNQMASSYHWKPLEENDSHAKPTKQGNYSKTEVASAEWDPLMSALDDALYEFARLKYESDQSELPYEFVNQAQVDQYFASGPLFNCTNVCCGPCTLY